MTAPRILMNCIRMHRKGDNAFSGNVSHCLRLITALEQLQQIDLHVHVDEQTLSYIAPVIPHDRLVLEDRSVNSVIDMELSIRRAVKRIRPDLYHKPIGQLPLLPIGCKSVWGVADLGYRHLPMGRIQRLYKQISYRVSARKAVRILTVSDSTNREVVEALNVPREKVQTIYPGTTSFECPVEVYPNLSPRFVITFAHQRHKNVEKVIEAVAAVRASGIELALIVVGSLDYRQDLDRVAAENKISEHVIYTGHVSDGQLRHLYENALCLAFLSRHEGFGLPVLEAMNAGCPVISSDAFALPEVVGDAAPIYDCDDHEGVASELRNFISDESYRESWIAKGHANAKKFTWQRAAEETVAVYRSEL